MVCKNCGAQTKGNYCAHCGQSTSVGPINLSNLLKELPNNFLQLNRGFLYTLVMLFRRPGVSIRAYLQGQRKRYTKPITYLLALSALYLFVSKTTGQHTWMDDLITGFSTGAQDTDAAQLPWLLVWFAQNYAYTTLLVLPVFSLASYWSFRGSGTNYLEHFVLNSYITGQQAILYVLFALLKTVMDSEVLELLPVLFAVIYTCWVFGQFFEVGNRGTRLLRSMLTYLLYLVLSFGLLLGVVGLSVLTT